MLELPLHTIPCEPFIDGLRAMEEYMLSQNKCIRIPVNRVMNVVQSVLIQMLSAPELREQADYDRQIIRAMGGEQPLAFIVMVTLIAMLQRTDGRRAQTCRSMMMEDRCEDFYEGVTLYERLLDSDIPHLAEEDFLTDIMREVVTLRAENTQLKNELKKQLNTIETMSKQPKTQTTVYNYGTYNDIHDNPQATIYTAPQEKVPETIIPQEGDYSALVRWLELEKLKGNDHYADADFNRTKLCRNLLKIIGWEPDQNSLRKAQNR